MKIVIYQTSDLHGYIYPTNYVNDQPLGFLKIASYILNDEKNYDASLKIDCGDLVQGSALTHFLSKQAIDENPIIKGLEAINYNAYVLGNHEFNYGLNYLKNAYDKISDKVINANIKGLPFNTKPYEIFDFNGFKVGCIGFTTVYIPNWEQEANINQCIALKVFILDALAPGEDVDDDVAVSPGVAFEEEVEVIVVLAVQVFLCAVVLELVGGAALGQQLCEVHEGHCLAGLETADAQDGALFGVVGVDDQAVEHHVVVGGALECGLDGGGLDADAAVVEARCPLGVGAIEQRVGLEHGVVVAEVGVGLDDVDDIVVGEHIVGVVDLTEGEVKVLGVADERDGGVCCLVALDGHELVLEGIDGVRRARGVQVGNCAAECGLGAGDAQGVPERVEGRALVLDEVVVGAGHGLGGMVERDDEVFVVGDGLGAAVFCAVGLESFVPVFLHGDSLEAVATGLELALAEVYGVAILGEGRGADAVADGALGHFAAAFVIHVQLDVAHVVTEHVGALGIVIVNKTHIEACGTVLVVILHHGA